MEWISEGANDVLKALNDSSCFGEPTPGHKKKVSFSDEEHNDDSLIKIDPSTIEDELPPWDYLPPLPGTPNNTFELPAISTTELTASLQRGRPTTARPGQRQLPAKANAAPSCAILMKASGTTSPLDCSPSPPGTLDNSSELPAINKSQLTATPQRARPTTARPSQPQRPAKANAATSCGVLVKASRTTSPLDCSPSPPGTPDTSCELPAIKKSQLTAAHQRGRPTIARPVQRPRPAKVNAAPSCAILVKASGTTSPLNCSPSPPGTLDNSSELPAINKSQLTAARQRARPTTARPVQRPRPAKTNIAPSCGIEEKRPMCNCTPSPPGSMGLPLIDNDQFTATISRKEPKPTTSRPTQRRRSGQANIAIQQKRPMCTPSPPGSCEPPPISQSNAVIPPNVPKHRYMQESRPSRRTCGPTPAPPATRKPSTQMQGSTAIHKRKFKEKANQQSLAQKLEDKMKRAEENHRREIEKKRGRAQHSLDWWETGLAKNLELHQNDLDDTYVRARAKANEAAKRIA
ncbi:unnamed protein product [Owenia fusiformis]|uniref:Uncharacterized protein n=1 Tax=Owenia fusiformis TaxID=6347 RepID=A0A8J1UR05_OWEFU|nr:unnamed protein product [Owenia fusiformis]